MFAPEIAESHIRSLGVKGQSTYHCVMYSVRHGKLRKEMAAAREGAKMTQREFAAKLKRPPSYVAKVEVGERKIEVFEFVDWCQAVGVEPGTMLKRAMRD